MDKGVDGLRMDAIPNLYERQDLLDAPILQYNGKPQTYGYTEAIDETFYEVNEWRTLTEEYKKKDGQTRYGHNIGFYAFTKIYLILTS